MDIARVNAREIISQPGDHQKAGIPAKARKFPSMIYIYLLVGFYSSYPLADNPNAPDLPKAAIFMYCHSLL